MLALWISDMSAMQSEGSLACCVQALSEWQDKEEDRQAALANVKGGMDSTAAEDAQQEFVAYVPLPDQKEIEHRVMLKKKADLLAKYSSEATIKQQEESNAFLSKR